jgi:hypothetical protein
MILINGECSPWAATFVYHYQVDQALVQLGVSNPTVNTFTLNKLQLPTAQVFRVRLLPDQAFRSKCREKRLLLYLRRETLVLSLPSRGRCCLREGDFVEIAGIPLGNGRYKWMVEGQ